MGQIYLIPKTLYDCISLAMVVGATLIKFDCLKTTFLMESAGDIFDIILLSRLIPHQALPGRDKLLVLLKVPHQDSNLDRFVTWTIQNCISLASSIVLKKQPLMERLEILWSFVYQKMNKWSGDHEKKDSVSHLVLIEHEHWSQLRWAGNLAYYMKFI